MEQLPYLAIGVLSGIGVLEVIQRLATRWNLFDKDKFHPIIPLLMFSVLIAAWGSTWIQVLAMCEHCCLDTPTPTPQFVVYRTNYSVNNKSTTICYFLVFYIYTPPGTQNNRDANVTAMLRIYSNLLC